ncbi:hypothetical protein Tco_1102746 [Tanacetum coccineum]
MNNQQPPPSGRRKRRQQQPPNPSLNTQNQSLSNSCVISIEKKDEAVVMGVLIAGGEHVSSWKVSRAAHVTLGGLDSLGVDMRHVPSLNRLITLEHKADQQMASLTEFRRNRAKSIEFSSSLFMIQINGIEVKGDELLDFIAKKRSVDSKEKLHVRIQSLGLYIGWILQVRSLENGKYKKCLSDAGSKIMELPILMSQKKPLEDNLSALSEHIKLFSEDNNEDCESNHEDETCLPSQSKNSSQDMKSSEQFIGSLSLDNTLVKKRKSDVIDCIAFQSHKILKRDGVEQSSRGTKISKRPPSTFYAGICGSLCMLAMHLHGSTRVYLRVGISSVYISPPNTFLRRDWLGKAWFRVSFLSMDILIVLLKSGRLPPYMIWRRKSAKVRELGSLRSLSWDLSFNILL